jgi:hypothetical protein
MNGLEAPAPRLASDCSTAAQRLSIIKFTGPKRMPSEARASHEFIHSEKGFYCRRAMHLVLCCFVVCLQANSATGLGG